MSALCAAASGIARIMRTAMPRVFSRRAKSAASAPKSASWSSRLVESSDFSKSMIVAEHGARAVDRRELLDDARVARSGRDVRVPRRRRDLRGHDYVSRRGAVPRGERLDERDGPRAAEAAVHLALGIEAGFRGDPAWRVHPDRRAVYDELGDARDAAHAHAPHVRLGGHGARAPVPRFEDRGEVCHDFFCGDFFVFAICAQLRILFLARGVLHKSTSPEKRQQAKKEPQKNDASIVAAYRDPGRREPIAWPGRERAAARAESEANAPTAPGPVELAIRNAARASRARRPRARRPRAGRDRA